MKKVGILTLYHKNYNFGGLLQAYALPIALHKYFEFESEQIDYKYAPTYIQKENLFERPYNMQNFLYKCAIYFFSFLLNPKLSKRKKKMDQFINEIPHSSQTYSYESITECLKDYDIYICGGDQIWNDDCQSLMGKDNIQVFTLQFVPQYKRKLSYAPSMAILDTSVTFREIFKKGLQEFNAISIREKQSLPIIQQLTDKPVTIVVDPVLLLTKDDWETVARPAHSPKKYILCYLLGDSISQRERTSQLAKKLNLPIVTFSHALYNVVRKCDLFFADVHDYTSGPREFIDLVKNAELVVTDSFHACVFSMIFQTPFMVFERHKPGQEGNMNSRIYNFLEEYHLEKQLVNENQMSIIAEIPSVDFSYSHSHWEKRRQESLNYLEKALHN